MRAPRRPIGGVGGDARRGVAYRALMRVHAVRLTPGTDLNDALVQLIEAQHLRAGFVLTCVGSLSRARLRMPSGAGQPEAYQAWSEPMEIVSLTGTLGADGAHLHISLSRRDGSCVGGHLAAGCIVHTTAEVVLGDAEVFEFRRKLDPTTGYGELEVITRKAALSSAPS